MLSAKLSEALSFINKRLERYFDTLKEDLCETVGTTLSAEERVLLQGLRMAGAAELPLAGATSTSPDRGAAAASSSSSVSVSPATSTGSS